MSLTVILADYFAGSISASEAVRKSGLPGIDDLLKAVKTGPAATLRRESLPMSAECQPARLSEPV